MSESLTRARIFINFATKIGLRKPYMSTNPTSLRVRIAQTFAIEKSLAAEAAVLINALVNLEELEHQTRDFIKFDETLKNECIASIVQLKMFMGPSYWEQDVTQWSADLEKHMRNLSIVDSILSQTHSAASIDSNLIDSLIELLEKAKAELQSAEVVDGAQRDRLVKTLAALVQYFRNTDCMSMDDAIDIASKSIFEAAEFAAKEKGWLNRNCVLNALVMVHVALTGARDVRDNISFVGEIAAQIKSISDHPALPSYLEVKALPAPRPRVCKEDEE